MIRIVYVSTSRLGLTDADVKQILQQARERNKAKGITGLLVFNGLNFIQALEGEAEPVLATMSAISRDPRHSGDARTLFMKGGRAVMFGQGRCTATHARRLPSRH